MKSQHLVIGSIILGSVLASLGHLSSSCPVKEPISLEEAVENDRIGSSTSTSSTSTRTIVYQKLSKKDIIDPDSGFTTSHSEFYIDSGEWSKLRKGLSKEELYHEVKNIPMKLVTTLDLGLIARLAHGDINNEDMVKRFMFSSDQYIRLKQDTDRAVYFNDKDKKTLRDILENKIISPIKKDGRYLFPNSTEMILTRVNGDVTIVINVYQDGKYVPMPEITFKDLAKRDLIERYFMSALLSKDLATERKAVPLDTLYQLYKNR